MNVTPSHSPASWTATMFGWSSIAATRASNSKRRRASSSPSSGAATTFSATVRCSDSCVAR